MTKHNSQSQDVLFYVLWCNIEYQLKKKIFCNDSNVRVNQILVISTLAIIVKRVFFYKNNRWAKTTYILSQTLASLWAFGAQVCSITLTVRVLGWVFLLISAIRKEDVWYLYSLEMSCQGLDQTRPYFIFFMHRQKGT